MQRLVDADEVSAAFRIARTVKPILGGDPAFDRLWADITVTSMSLKTDPAGAEVRVKPYDAPDGEWRTVGRTPIEGLELARGYTRFRLEKPGFEPVDLAFAPMALSRQRPFRLVRQADAPAGMVLVPGGPFKFRSAPQVELADFWLDRYEVTNRQFAEFVNAGGYRRRELWKHPFVRAGKTLSFDAAVALFRDGTGRPGPSTWELGSFPEGRAEYPVAGVSWYEAAAYAEFAGKSLPTFHHWYRAADLTRFSDILRFSNFGNQGPRPVGQQPSLTTYGNYDMAGNVREWVWNSDGERRYTLGGAWSDPTYLYTGPDALDPMDRSAILGIRCARYETPPPPATLDLLRNVVRDATLVRPADDATFAIYRRLIEYDPLDLDARVESVDERPEHWRVEKVSFAAAYGGERIPALLFLPKNARPPFQTVIYCPPGSALFLPSIDKVGGRDFDFLVRSGRAVLFPVYQQTYQRRRPAQVRTQRRAPGADAAHPRHPPRARLPRRPRGRRPRARRVLRPQHGRRPRGDGRVRRDPPANAGAGRDGAGRGAAARRRRAQLRPARAHAGPDDQRPVRLHGAVPDEPGAALPPARHAGQGQEARRLRERPRAAVARRRAGDAGLARPLPGTGRHGGRCGRHGERLCRHGREQP